VANTDLTQSIGTTFGNTYEVEFTVSNYSAGNVVAVVGNLEGTDRAANGTFIEIISSGAGTDIDIRGDLDFVGDIDDVIVRKVNTINGASTLTMSTQYDRTELIFNGEWEA